MVKFPCDDQNVYQGMLYILVTYLRHIYWRGICQKLVLSLNFNKLVFFSFEMLDHVDFSLLSKDLFIQYLPNVLAK